MKNFLELQCDKNNINKVIDYIIYLQQNYNINIFLLSGEVGSGKTFLIKKYAEFFGIKDVSSPTFSFIHEYLVLDSINSPKIFHYDLYLKNTQENKLKLIESISQKGIHFIEWGDNTLAHNLYNLGFYPATITIDLLQNIESRFYKILCFS